MLTVLASLTALAAPCGPATPAEATPLPQTPPSPAAVAELEAYAFPEGLQRMDPERKGVRTDGVLILRNGQQVYARYGGSFGPDDRHLVWSVTKAYTGLLTARAVQLGALRLDDSICQHLSGLPPESCVVTVGHLLTHTSGFDWTESYEDASPVTSSVLAMLYGEGSLDMARFVARHPLRDPPGTSYSYSTGDTTLLAAVVGAALSPTYGADWPWDVLFTPLGMTHTTFESDPQGTYVGGSLAWSTLTDMSRIGSLLLQDGCWAGERLLPDDWVRQATSPDTVRHLKVLDRDDGSVPGWTLWLNQVVPEIGQQTPPWPGVPTTAYSALGHWKQAIFVSPEDGVVIVRTGDDRDGSFSWDRFFTLARRVALEAP